jgi:hypothetical protein
MHLSPKLKIAFLSASWFALVAGVCFPLAMALLPFAAPQTLSQTGNGVLSGLQIFGPAAAVAGFLLANRAVRANVAGSFLLGVLVVVLTCILAAFFAVLMVGRSYTVQAFVGEAFATAFGFLFVDLILFKGVPFIAGGFAMLAFRALVFSRRVPQNER